MQVALVYCVSRKLISPLRIELVYGPWNAWIDMAEILSSVLTKTVTVVLM